MTEDDTTTGGNGLPVFDTEQAFQDFLEKKFEENGFTAIQEVRPARSNYRADLLLIHDEFGKIGLELKRLTGGSDAGRAHQQIIRQYAGKRYIGDRVYLWVFAPYLPKLQSAEETDQWERSTWFQRGKLEVLEHFFQRYGIGVLNVHESGYARLKWGHTAEHMLPAFPLKTEIPDRNKKEYKLDSIRERVAERLYPDRDVFTKR
jgi:hypothetical protein